ncbi:hypothetical protein Smp_128500 [Schistosoma mansoni]|uniref:hypothetical protein n=1 Tax=Schistosoma mansoni TaxID=6183 RepID=UPI00022DC9B5|nr:hypothetical protein Smp_128500 [Schistosoma mansoni]|eukprot:XP_018654420.1 hypothetical protein Smp_128500 [Schistosoma mansoni]
MLIKDYLDQNAPSSDQFYDLIQSYKLEYGLILLRDYKNLLNLYKTMKMSYENYKHLTNYMIQYIWEKLHTAQYDIFSQIPELENDIYIPDYCYITGGSDESINDNNNNNTIETNLWFGPKNTISPLHHDNDRANLLTQINGSKLIILYPSIETKNLYPYNDLLSNTSQIDLDHIDLIKFPKLKNAYGYYGIIKKGEMLYIPPRCWHYVRSLTCSFSVNFWWNLSPSLIPSWT